MKQKVLFFIDAFLSVCKGWGCVLSVLTSSGNRVGLQCWEVGSCECEITLCSSRDTHSATNKMNGLVSGRIGVNVVTLTYIALTFACSYISVKKQLNLANHILECQVFL